MTFTNNTSDAQTLTLNLEAYQLTADSNTIDAIGTSSSTIHAKVTGFDGKPVAGKQFRLEAYGGDSVITPESGTTDSSGQIDFHVTDSTFEEVTYSLKDSDDSLYLGSPVSVVFNQWPTAVTEPASAIASTSAVLNGKVDDQGAETTVSFDYGTTMSYGSTAAATTGGTVAAGAGGTPVAVTLQGLMSETTYHYRVIATNSSGTRQGTDQTFTTGASVTMYAVTYAAGDHGTISSTSESVAQGEHPAGVPAVTPADGYSFAGWSSDEGATLLSGSDVAATTVNGDITYTARYTPISYTVSFNTGGGSEVTAQQVNYNGHATEPVAAPTKEGYTFGGWYTDDAYGTAFDFANTAIKGSTTVYAKWTINSYTVSFNTAGGSEVTAQQVNYNGHASEPVAAPTKEGYAFGGWYTDDAYGTAFDFTNTAIKGNTTVYAKWIINGYTVSFNTDGGTEVPAQQVNYNGHATQPVTAPTKEGYTFGGWYTDDAYGTAFDFANTAIKGNTTVYAKWIINGYTVSFNTDGGTEVPAQQVNYNGHATQPVTAPTKEGYTFGGWYTDDAYGTAFDFANTAIKGNTTVYAKWIINGYTVSFNTDGGTEVPAQQVNYNGHATQPATAPTKEGYTFGGWYTDDAYGTAFDFANTAIKGSTTVYAKWIINGYTVSFNTDGGTEVPAQQVNYNGHATQPATAPTKEGYTFGGWYTDDAYGTAFDFANTAIKGSTTVYAKWIINGYTVSFNTDGGTEVPAQQVNYNGHATQPATAPTKEGYTFGGWYTDDAYGTAFDFANTAITGTTTVYAKWNINQYTVSFNTDGGTEVPAQQVNYNGHVTEPVTAPTKEGYTFGGWYTDDAYGTAFDFANTAIKGSTTVYAKWIINGYTVSFNTDGGTEVPAQQVNYNGHATQPATAPTKEGYTFGGWYTDAAYGTAFDFANMAIKGNTTVYAKWSINQYTVSFNTAGGSEVTAQQINYNGHVTEPATAPTKEGYTFGGWYTDDAYGTAFDFANTAITGTTTVYAKWDINGYTVSFNTGGGSEVTAQQVNYNGHASEPVTAPTKEGYAFSGWYTDDAYGTAFDFTNTAIKNNTTVYAKWTINGYTVSFNTDGGTKVTAQQVNYNGHASEPVTAPTKEGYTFGGWYTDDAYGTAFDFANTAIKGNTTVYAKWTINNYAVSFNTGGGTEVPAQQVNYNGHASEPVTAPTKEGYAFSGWYTDDAYGTAFDFANTAIKGNTTVYAKWTINSYTVSFNTAGGTEVPAQQVNYNGHASEPATAPTKAGYMFAGWYTDSNSNEPFHFTEQAITSNLTLSAKWIMNVPGVPVIQSAAAGDAQVTVTWTQVPGASGYKIYQSTAAGSYANPLTTVSGAVYSYTSSGLKNGTPYYYVVKAINEGGDSAPSNEITATPQVLSPGAPEIVAAQPGNKQVRLNWKPVAGAVGYTVYSGTASGKYGKEAATVSGSVYSYEVTGLTNGTTYYFVVKATNPGGESPVSNEVSATPKSVPSAPTSVTAVAGKGQAVITFTPSDDDGGSPITGYEVAASPGNITVSGTASPITVTGLTNGIAYTFTVKAVNGVGAGTASEPSNAVTPFIPSKGGGGGTSAPSTGSNTSGASTGVDVLVNGKAENAGTATTATVNNQSVTTIAVDPKKLEEKLAAEGQHAVITIPMTAKSDVVVGELNGQMVKNMESSQAVVELKTDSATYTLPAQQINIDAISEQIGKSVPLEAIRIQIEIAKPEASMAQVVENAAAKGEFTIVAPAVQFTVKGTYGDKTIEVSKFNAYVERTIVIPDGVDPKKITTAVVVDPDGTVRHVPTRIVVEDGRYVAKINSLTNSTYSVVWHPLEFKDVAQHWAKDSVNDMGSRMVINGVSDDRFNPDQEITRAEFAAILVRALGLKPEAGAAPFTDVHNSDWYAGAIQTAYAYQLIGGFEDGTFRPTDSITREQAMTIMSKAMTITELKQKLGSGAAALNTFEDADTVSGWAAKAISDCLQAGLVTGRGDHRLEPQASISRAEVAAIVQRLLQKSGLI
ncbi:InlB B-repeat-containing protein [Paenibacillus doosanensis]|uniref:InlB B-repeat-containing protein n=1 Tax=Paenibacillus doosanensis TaxID=1229154 RepID=UPI002180565B|nr:InlB B-repeat-containing protein [Paenibacillus doosanensis]